MAADPLTAFIGNMGSGIGKGLGNAISGEGGGPMLSGGTVDARGFLDGSGWTVATGGSRAQGGTSGGTRQDAMQPAQVFGGGASQAGMNPLLMLVMAGAFAWYIAKN